VGVTNIELTVEPINIKVFYYPTEYPIVIQQRNIAIGNNFICWINDDNNNYGGSITCDGDNDIPSNIAVVSETEGWIQISAGGKHICGLSIDNQIKCWGSNTRSSYMPEYTGHFPQNTFNSESEYLKTNIYKFKRIVAFDDTTCALHTNGKLQCWGLDHIIYSVDNENDYYSNNNIVDLVFDSFDGCTINKFNELKCLGASISTIELPINKTLGISLFDNSVCALYIPYGNTTYSPICFGGLYSSTTIKYYDFSSSYTDIIHIIQGEEFVCFIDRATLKASCIGDVRKFSSSGTDWNVFSNIYVTESDVTETSVMFVDTNRNIKLYGDILDVRNNTLIDSIII
jgi:hypothetical protein